MLGAAKFKDENVFSVAFARHFIRALERDARIDPRQTMPLKEELKKHKTELELLELFEFLSDICREAPKPVILLVDEVDSASNNQVFLDFLAQLRGYYINRKSVAAFHSVILAGIYDVKSIKRKIRSDEEQKDLFPHHRAPTPHVEFPARLLASVRKLAKSQSPARNYSLLGRFLAFQSSLILAHFYMTS